MSDINIFVDSVVSSISNQFPELNTCVSWPGFLETTDLSVIHANTPGVFVAPVGSGAVTPIESGETDVTLHMVAYLLVVNTDSLQREDTAQRLLTGLLGYIGLGAQRWGLPNAHPATAVESEDVHGLTSDFQPHVKDWRLGTAILARAADLYGGPTNPISNLALWAITWEQTLRVGNNVFDNSGETVPDNPQVRENSESGFISLVNS